MNFNDMMMSMTGKTDSKIGYTTTVKDQVEEIEVCPCLTPEQNLSFQENIGSSEKTAERTPLPNKKTLGNHKNFF